MTVRERLSYAGEKAEEKFGVEDVLVRANIASPRNILSLKKFLQQLKEKSEPKEVRISYVHLSTWTLSIQPVRFIEREQALNLMEVKEFRCI